MRYAADRIRFFNFVAETILRDGADACRAAVAEKSPRLLRRFDLLARCIREGMSPGQYAETSSLSEWLEAARSGREAWQ